MNLFKKLIYKKSISNELKDIKHLLIKECLSQRNKRNKSAFNFNVDSQYTNYLYNIFYNLSKNHLSNFNFVLVYSFETLYARFPRTVMRSHSRFRRLVKF